MDFSYYEAKQLPHATRMFRDGWTCLWCFMVLWVEGAKNFCVNVAAPTDVYIQEAYSAIFRRLREARQVCYAEHSEGL